MFISKKLLLWGLILGLSLLSVERGWEARKWKRSADYRGFLSDRSALYLFGPSGLVDKNGTPVRRIDILDTILADPGIQAKFGLHPQPSK